MIVDTHCHLADDAFDADRERVILSLAQNNVGAAFVVGTDLAECKKAIELAEKYENIYAILGLYPEYAEQYDQFESFLEDNLSNPKVVAVGEIGLDFHTEGYNQKLQEEVFAKQIKLAYKYNLPISIHTRDAFDRTLKVLKDNKQYLHGGVIHCFSGSPEIAEEFIKLGFKLGFGGVCTFKNARKVVDTLKKIKPEDILLETDSPYLAPTPHRGERNEPKYTNFVLDKIAEIRLENKEILEKQILENTKNTFKRFSI
ncbi:MAG: TatD family hydrolase [Clostridia bacterium]|nr:TatD family hydrolase [Clostridia bacterium]